MGVSFSLFEELDLCVSWTLTTGQSLDPAVTVKRRRSVSETPLTNSDFVEDTDEHLIALPMYLGEIHVLEIAFLHSLAIVKQCESPLGKTAYLPCLATKSPFIDILEDVFAAMSVLATVCLRLPFVVFYQLPATSNAMSEWFHR
jgi:hypothetical protein